MTAIKNFLIKFWVTFKNTLASILDFIFERFMKFILLYLFVVITLFVLKMINLYEVTGGYPITLTKVVVGGVGLEVALTAMLQLRKYKSDIDDGVMDKLKQAKDRVLNRDDGGDDSFG